MAYRKTSTASVSGSALDRLAGKVAELCEALVANWRWKVSESSDSGKLGRIEMNLDTATQAFTLEVIHVALFSETLDV
jgi:hypothetical protein